MKKWKRLSVLLLLAPLQACSIAGADPSPPPVQFTTPALCKSLVIVDPSKTQDKISEPTAHKIASNNIAIETGCKA